MQNADDIAEAQRQSLYASSIGATASARSIAPNMIGDFFGSSGSESTIVVLGPEQTLTNYNINSGGYFFEGNLVATDRVAFIKDLAADAFFQSTNIPPTLNVGQVLALDNNQPYTTASGDPPTAGQPPLQIVNGTATINNSFLADLSFRQAQTAVVFIPSSPSAGASVGRFKISENTSPMPRDRVFLDYDYFHNVPLTRTGIGVNRYAPGFEKTFLNGWGSFELRVPMAATLNSTIVAGQPTDNNHYEFGNVAFTTKGLLYRGRVFALSTGLCVQVPTADAVQVSQSDGTQLVRIRNQAVHLQPFFGGLYTPNNRFFAQGFLQVDTPTGGDTVLINPTGNGLTNAGRINDATFLYASLGIGSWFYQRKEQSGLTGLAWTTELHYNRSLNKSDGIQNGGFFIGVPGQNVEVLNATVGLTLRMRQRSMLTAAYVTPLTGGADRQFDGQVRVLYNYFFGRPSRFTRVPIF